MLGARVLAEFGDDPRRYTDARARNNYADKQRTRGLGHRAALRKLANRLVGILHGCLTTVTPYEETTAWNHHTQDQHAAA